jgi:hypothetical protein
MKRLAIAAALLVSLALVGEASAFGGRSGFRSVSRFRSGGRANVRVNVGQFRFRQPALVHAPAFRQRFVSVQSSYAYAAPVAFWQKFVAQAVYARPVLAQPVYVQQVVAQPVYAQQFVQQAVAYPVCQPVQFRLAVGAGCGY